jgi:hypothetical protein
LVGIESATLINWKKDPEYDPNAVVSTGNRGLATLADRLYRECQGIMQGNCEYLNKTFPSGGTVERQFHRSVSRHCPNVFPVAGHNYAPPLISKGSTQQGELTAER